MSLIVLLDSVDAKITTCSTNPGIKISSSVMTILIWLIILLYKQLVLHSPPKGLSLLTMEPYLVKICYKIEREMLNMKQNHSFGTVCRHEGFCMVTGCMVGPWTRIFIQSALRHLFCTICHRPSFTQTGPNHLHLSATRQVHETRSVNAQRRYSYEDKRDKYGNFRTCHTNCRKDFETKI